MNNSFPLLSTVSFGFAIISKDYIVQFINDSFVQILDCEVVDILKRDLARFLPQLKTFSLKTDYECKKILTFSGKELSIKVQKIDGIVKDLFLVFCFDFSSYESILKQLNDSNNQLYLYNSMFNSLQDGIFITDDKGKTLFVNDFFIKLSGLTREAILGKTVYYLMENKIVPNSCCAKVIETNHPSSTINNYFGGKSCLVSGSPIFDSNDELKMVISVIRDVSELEQLRQNLANEKFLSMSYKSRLKQLETKKSTGSIITKSKIMEDIYDKASKVASIDSSILILGETGVGKDFLANYIHQISKRSENGPFIKINCGAIPENLLESELFGYEAGAFTGANRQGKTGLFELANQGTLFMDEIGDMPYNLQVKILNAIQDKKIYRLGGNKVISFNPRIIAATNANLEDLVDQKKFRIDLYYRLNVINIKIPSLRQRKEDIIPLAMEFLKQFNEHYCKSRYFASKTLELFLAYEWPGNIREVKNLIERLVIISNKDCIEPEFFYEQIIDKRKLYTELFYSDDIKHHTVSKITLKERLETYEAHILEEAITTHNTLKEAAATLNVDLSTLVRKKRKYGL